MNRCIRFEGPLIYLLKDPVSEELQRRSVTKPPNSLLLTIRTPNV